MDDHALLRDYVERQSEAAFAELVARHVNLVYGTARRVVGDSAAAQDVVQSVFIHLARKAWTVRDGRALPGWLYRAAYRTALDAIRSEQRRRQRETEAMKLAEINSTDEAAWEKLAPLLDEAMQHLNRAEQDAVVFRFFEGKTMRETGTALGTTEAAAQMRVNRALEKMRTHFARGGVTVAAGALALVLSARPSEAAPTGLAARVTGPSLAGAGGAAVGFIFGRILFMSTKIKILTAVICGFLIIAIFTIKLSEPQSAISLTTLHSSSAAPKNNINSPSDKTRAVAMPVVAAILPNEGTIVIDPQADLKTAIPDMARWIRSDGVAFAYYSPDDMAKLTPEQIQNIKEGRARAMGNLRTRRGFEALAQSYEALVKQSPIFDSTGTEATYKYTGVTDSDITNGVFSGTGEQQPLTFIKIDGKWYIKSGH